MKQFHHLIQDREFCIKCSSDIVSNEKHKIQSDIIVKNIQMKDFSGLYASLKKCKGSTDFYRFFFLRDSNLINLSSCKS